MSSSESFVNELKVLLRSTVYERSPTSDSTHEAYLQVGTRNMFVFDVDSSVIRDSNGLRLPRVKTEACDPHWPHIRGLRMFRNQAGDVEGADRGVVQGHAPSPLTPVGSFRVVLD